MLLPGVTDPVAAEIMRVAQRAGIDLRGVATGRRFVVDGDITNDQLETLTAKLLANAIIERWSIDVPIAPSFVPSDGEMSSVAERLAFDASATLE